MTFGTTRVVGRQPYAPAAFTPGEIPGIHFQGLSRPQGPWFRRGEPRKKSPVTPPGIDPGTVRLEAQCLNHYATPVPKVETIAHKCIADRRKKSKSNYGYPQLYNYHYLSLVFSIISVQLRVAPLISKTLKGSKAWNGVVEL